MSAMFGMDLREVISASVRGIHAGRNSEQAAGVVGAEDYLRLGKPTKAMHMSLDLRSHYFWYKRKGGRLYEVYTAYGVHFLFHRTYGSTGHCATYTFFGLCDSQFARLGEVKEWEYLSSHDSCWLDAATQRLSTVYFNMASELVKAGGFTEKKSPAPKDLGWNVWFNDFPTTEFYEWVDVQIDHIQREPGRSDGYKVSLL